MSTASWTTPTEYVRGKVHTNGLENFWSLLKRGLKGTYVSVEPFHLFRYLDEQVFRFNNRKATDGSRFLAVARSIVGKRLTYKELIGADLPALQTCMRSAPYFRRGKHERADASRANGKADARARRRSKGRGRQKGSRV